MLSIVPANHSAPDGRIFVCVYYTATTPNPHNRVSRFTASGNKAVPGSERILFELERLGAGRHGH